MTKKKGLLLLVSFVIVFIILAISRYNNINIKRFALLYYNEPTENITEYFNIEFEHINNITEVNNFDLVVVDSSVKDFSFLEDMLHEMREYINNGGRVIINNHELLKELIPNISLIYNNGYVLELSESITPIIYTEDNNAAIAAVITMGLGEVVFFCSSFMNMQVPINPVNIAFAYLHTPIENISQYLEQPLIYNMNFSQINLSTIHDLNEFDLVIVDSSVNNFSEIASYIKNGGRVAITSNSRQLLQYIMPDISFIPYKHESGIHVGNLPDEFYGMGRIFIDYMYYFNRFKNIRNIQQAGYSLHISDGVIPIVYSGDRQSAVSAIMQFGEGEIYYFGAILPDSFFTTSFDFITKDGELPYFNHTTAGAEHLLWNELASIISMDIHGFALKRVFGSHGRPSMAYQNHIEILSPLGAGATQIWANMAKEHGQIASIALTYGIYEWFMRYESFGFALGNEYGGFENDRTRNFYSWGEHIVHDNRWLNLAQSPDMHSFFVDPTKPMRSFPSVIDFNNDNIPDLISGSSDGYFHVFKGVEFSPRWIVESIGKLTDSQGNPLSVGGFSAPTIYGDKMVSGSIDGRLFIWDWYGGLEFSDSPNIINPPHNERLSAPDILPTGDIIVGFESGNIYLFDGSYSLILQTGEEFVVPRAIDNGLIVGTQDGSILRYINDNGNFIFDGWLLEGEGAGPINHKGLPGINSGNNITPLLVDLNNDGILDLVWGLLESGEFAVALSDEFFPYMDQLLDDIYQMNQLFVPILLHSYTHIFAYPEDEILKLQAEIAALQSLGIDAPRGVNQHTWQISWQSPGQTLFIQKDLGFLWNFGFRPSNSPVDPSYNSEYGLIVPFYLMGEDSRMLLFSANLVDESDLFATSARYGLPVTIYKHVGYDAIRNPSALYDFLETIRKAQERHMFNFVNEVQLAYSIAATMNTDIKVYANIVDYVSDFINKRIGTPQGLRRSLFLDYGDESIPLFNKNFAGSVGTRVNFRNNQYVHTNAHVFFNEYISLAGGEVEIWAEDTPMELNIISVNLPANISKNDNYTIIEFLDDGLQQVFVHSTKEIIFDGEDFEIKYVGDNIYRISKTGFKSVLRLKNPL